MAREGAPNKGTHERKLTAINAGLCHRGGEWQIPNFVLKDSGMEEGEHEAHGVKVGGVDGVGWEGGAPGEEAFVGCQCHARNQKNVWRRCRKAKKSRKLGMVGVGLLGGGVWGINPCTWGLQKEHCDSS